MMMMMMKTWSKTGKIRSTNLQVTRVDQANSK